MVRQPKGKKHIRMIHRRALRLWKEIDCEKGMKLDCIKEVLKKHRERLYQELEEKEKELRLRKEEYSKFSEYHCDNNGWLG